MSCMSSDLRWRGTPSVDCCCIVVLCPRLTSKVMSGRSVNLTTLFLGRLRPRAHTFASNWQLPFLKKAEGETKGCCQTGYPTQDPWLTSQVPYRLRYAARLFSGSKMCSINSSCILRFFLLRQEPLLRGGFWYRKTGVKVFAVSLLCIQCQYMAGQPLTGLE